MQKVLTMVGLSFQGYGVERKMNLASIILLLDTAVHRYGQFEVAEDDWRKSHDYINVRALEFFFYFICCSM
jgi:hypothetical protein